MICLGPIGALRTRLRGATSCDAVAVTDELSAAISDENTLSIKGATDAEVLLFDLA